MPRPTVQAARTAFTNSGCAEQCPLTLSARSNLWTCAAASIQWLPMRYIDGCPRSETAFNLRPQGSAEHLLGALDYSDRAGRMVFMLA